MKYNWYVMEATPDADRWVYKNGEITYLNINSPELESYSYASSAQATAATRRVKFYKLANRYPDTIFAVVGIPCKN